MRRNESKSQRQKLKMGLPEGLFLNVRNEYMGRFCNTPTACRLLTRVPSLCPFPWLALRFLSSLTKSLSTSVFSSFPHPVPSVPPPQPCSPFPVSSVFFPCALFICLLVLLAACLAPVLCFNVDPWELEFTAKQEGPVSRKLGMGQGLNGQQ